VDARVLDKWQHDIYAGREETIVDRGHDKPQGKAEEEDQQKSAGKRQ
jgi:hypothetical protein